MKVLLCLLLVMVSTSNAATIRIASLNMHGPHPMGESTRFIEKPDGQIRKSSSHPFYFTQEEISRGNTKRLDYLANQFNALNPDIIALQEITGGRFDKANKSCDDFEQLHLDNDSEAKNTALRLEARLKKYNSRWDSLLSCRGNVGWFTGPNDFLEKRVIRYNADKDKEVVIDYGDNPAPHGMVVEGMAFMVNREEIIVHDVMNENLIFNSFGHQVFVPFLVFSKRGEDGWFIMSNLHLGHKLAHFEQAIAIRKYVQNYVKVHPEFGKYKGEIHVGDFNATIYDEQADFEEPSMVPWLGNTGQNDLSQWLTDFNESSFKPWATVPDSEAPVRINEALSALQEQRFSPLKDSFVDGKPKDYVIDHLLMSDELSTYRSTMIFERNNWVTLEGPSDHPGLFVVLEY